MKLKSKQGIMLMNLGSPDSTNVSDLKKYLTPFLMDKRVIDKPWPSRFLLVRGIIIPFRAPKSAEAYKKIWTDEGSPLILHTQDLQQALSQKTDCPIAITMRYGNPTPEAAFKSLLDQQPDLDEVILFPLYPHYAMSSYETAVEHVKDYYNSKNYNFRLRVVPPYYQEQSYISALAESMKSYLDKPYDHVLFSYHGVPERHLHKSDITGGHCMKCDNCCEKLSPAHAYCYRHQLITTTRLVTQQLQIPEEKYSISYQSRLGKGWLTPFTDHRIKELPSEGVKRLLVVCPAFVSDCLETLEEIGMEGKELFLNAGGESFTMIPCLNTHPLWVESIYQLLESAE